MATASNIRSGAGPQGILPEGLSVPSSDGRAAVSGHEIGRSEALDRRTHEIGR